MAIVLYLMVYSVLGAAITAFLVAFIIIIEYFLHQKTSKRVLLARKEEEKIFKLIDDSLSGFKEIKVNEKRNQDIGNDILVTTEQLKDLKVSVAKYNNLVSSTIEVVHFALIGCVSIVLPFTNVLELKESLLVTACLLFAWGPLLMIIRSFSEVVTLKVAIDNFNELEEQIQLMLATRLEVQNVETMNFSEKITLHNITYQYTDEDGEVIFSMQPISLEINKGEVIFITGGNGSGKSTLLKILTGLYFPHSGSIRVDSESINEQNLTNYRTLFSTIFTDFHIFTKLYSVEGMDDQIATLIQDMEIDHKVSFRGDAFSNINLSTGQRKRLAYIASILEDRPVIVLDEWAADQDPYFRKKYYHRMIQDLKAVGKTVVVVTHDDRYFQQADRIVKMEKGRIV